MDKPISAFTRVKWERIRVQQMLNCKFYQAFQQNTIENNLDNYGAWIFWYHCVWEFCMFIYIEL